MTHKHAGSRRELARLNQSRASAWQSRMTNGGRNDAPRRTREDTQALAHRELLQLKQLQADLIERRAELTSPCDRRAFSRRIVRLNRLIQLFSHDADNEQHMKAAT
jgi:hypothetical protein